MQELDYSLPIGSLVGKFKVQAILGAGGFGITYKAEDTVMHRAVALKEFLPQDLAARQTGDNKVLPKTNCSHDYQYGLEKFLDEARTLAKYEHNNIVGVYDVIEANGTAYLVMQYVEGQALDEHLKQIHFSGGMPESRIREIIEPLLKGLDHVHKSGLLHRDVKPGNIYLKAPEDGITSEPMLIDFGAARQSVGEKSKSMSAIVSDGYAPPEQYSSRSRQGAWTDLYAVGAVMYLLVMGEKPEPSIHRKNEIDEEECDPLKPLPEQGYSSALLSAINACLILKAKARVQSVASLQEILASETVKPDSKPSKSNDDDGTRKVEDSLEPDTSDTKEAFSNLARNLAIATTIFAIAVLVFFHFYPSFNLNQEEIEYSQNSLSVDEGMDNNQAERVAWKMAMRIDSKEGYESYLLDFPNGTYIKQAKQKLQAYREVNNFSNDLASALVEEADRLNHETFDEVKATELYKQAAEEGNTHGAAAYALRLYYARGLNMVDEKSARFWAEKALKPLTKMAEQGDARAQYRLGKLFYSVYENKKEAFKLLKLSAENNLAWSMTAVAYMYKKAEGITQDNDEAMHWFKKAANQEYAQAYIGIGSMYLDGAGVVKDYKEARRWYKKAMDKEYVSGFVNIGYMTEKGLGVAADAIEACRLYRIALDKGSATGMQNLAYCYRTGKGVNKDYQEALRLYKLSAKKGNANAMYNLGDMYRDGLGVNQNYAEAMLWYEKSAEKDFAAAFSAIGYLYEKGFGVKKNNQKAADWYQKGAEHGSSWGMYRLAAFYQQGKGVAQDYQLAMSWYKKAADKEYVSAYTSIGYLYSMGYGVKADNVEAVKWYTKAADKKNINGMFNLGVMYQNGEGITQDYQQAMYWFKQAANKGNASAMFNISVLYSKGNGVSKDLYQSMQWLLKAKNAGYTSGDMTRYLNEDAASLNSIAWDNALCKLDCDGALAVKYALLVTNYTDSANYLDTLAAAYARNGEYQIAVNTQEKAIAKLTSYEKISDFKKRLNLYKAGKPAAE